MLDFETCVLHNFRECDFTQNIHTDNHKSQMAQFCGHEEVSVLNCIDFQFFADLDIILMFRYVFNSTIQERLRWPSSM